MTDDRSGGGGDDSGAAPPPDEHQRGEPAPDERQRQLIDSVEGTYLVDAGPGTGKTFAVTRRYANVLASTAATPEDVLLITFTRNAATEMKDRIVGHCDYGTAELADAPIQTFHSLCHDVLREHGFDAPRRLGIDDAIPASTRVLEDDVVEASLFGEFFEGFTDDHPEYADVVRTVSDPSELLELVTQLAAKGVFPTADGWYRDGEAHLDGDFAAFRAQFDERNRQRGNRQSTLRSALNRYGDGSCYLPSAPEKAELRGDGKTVPGWVARRAFVEDREHLKSFVHDVYFGYLEFALARNYLNFGFLQLFAFVLLCEDDDLRERLAYDHVMVDEFQDSSEIQFKLALLLSASDNLCCVGDWKQSIYSFQYAAVENIIDFRERLASFAADLNDDADRAGGDLDDDVERVSVDADAVETIELTRNYRSPQSVVDFAEESLLVPATGYDGVDEDAVRDRVVSLEATSDRDDARIEALAHEDEHEAVLAKVHDVVGDDDYLVEGEDGELRLPEYGDVAVLTRTRDFGRQLQAVADDAGLPVAYEGGIELFRTDEAKLVLAWLRILESDADRGWAPVLERAGYALDEVEHLLDTGDYPEEMVAFREELAGADTLGGVLRRVLDRYGFTGPRADVLLRKLTAVHDSTTMTRGDLVRYLVRAIERGATTEVDTGAGDEAVTVQTIHATKGLEHPIVVLANMNAGRFPPSGGSSPTITYDDAAGLRQGQVYAEAHGRPHLYDNWHADVVRWSLARGHDEERRLLYVAITRAQHHVVFTAGDDPNRFLEELPVDVEPGTGDVPEFDVAPGDREVLSVSVPDPTGPRSRSPHDLMDDSVYEEVEDGRGKEFGTRVHDFAEAYALGEDVTPEGDDERNVVELLDSLPGEFRVEEPVYLPLEVDGEQVTISGIVDLVHVTDEAVDVVDYKTDRSRVAESEYRTQLSVYSHVLSSVYPEREVRPWLFYTAEGERVEVAVLSVEELEEVVGRE